MRVSELSELKENGQESAKDSATPFRQTETTRFRIDDTGLRTETRGSSDPYDIYYRKQQIKSGLNPTFYAYVYLLDHRHYCTSAWR